MTFPHHDKYLLILENSRALKRQVKEMDNWLDFREIEFDQKLNEFNKKPVVSDKNQVNFKFEAFKDLMK